MTSLHPYNTLPPDEAAPAWAQRHPAMRHILLPVSALCYRPRRVRILPCQNPPVTGRMEQDS